MIVLQDIDKQFGSKVLYQKASLTINPMYHIGLFGSNGAGKTVLLRIIAGEEKIDNGTICIPSELKIGYLPQEMEMNTKQTPLVLMLEPFQHLFSLEQKSVLLAETYERDQSVYKKQVEEFDTLIKEHSAVDIYSLEARAKSILTGLGIEENRWNGALSNLSGGYRMRVMLARLLLTEPDFLLLDEPTNHLDMDSLIWLEKFMQRSKSGMLVVSHDRDFLNRVTNHTIEISNAVFTQFSGSIDTYLQWKEQNDIREQKRTKNLQDKIIQTERFIERFKAKNTKASQARSRMKTLERLKEELPQQMHHSRSMRIRFPEPQRSGAIPLKLENITVSYGSADPVLKNLSLTVSRGEKIAVIGPNGAGKSTLLKACAGIVTPVSGSVVVGYNTAISYFSQHRTDQLDPEKSCYDIIADTKMSYNRQDILTLLGAFLFCEDEVEKKTKVLSGGEKSRLSLASMLAQPGNCLLLDEPTNHLDIISVERLCSALKQFSATILLVSHDEYFVSRIATRIIELRPGQFRDFPGSLTDYRTYIENGFVDPYHDTEDKQSPTTDTQKQHRKEKRERVKKLQRHLQKIENQITGIEQEIETLEKELHHPSHAQNYTYLSEITEQINQKRTDCEDLMHEWETTSCKVQRFTE